MGKYAVLLVMAMTFGLITYGHALRNNLLQSESRIVEEYGINQAKNTSQSMAMLAVQKIGNPDDDEFTPEVDQTMYIPEGGGFEPWEELGAEYRIEILNQGDSLLVMDTYSVFDGFEYMVSVTFNRNTPIWNPELSHAVFAGQSVDLEGSASINGDVGTNAITANSVNLKGSTTITGGMQIGPGGLSDETVNIDDWADQDNVVNGGISNLPSELDFELPPFPDFPPMTNIGSNIAISGGTGGSMPPGSFDNLYIPEISVRGNNTLTIDTGGEDRTLHVGNLNVQQGHIEVIGGGELTLMIEDNITLNGSSTINENGDQGNVKTNYKGTNEVDFGGATSFNGSLFAETANINLNGSGGIQGHIITGGTNVDIMGAAEAISRMIFAPNADIEIGGSGSVRGAIVADSFRGFGNASVIFDDDFDSEMPEFPAGEETYEVASWY
ncbi:MAG: hypothetical protein WEA58_11270 [Balneolaceae bacterium]